MRIMLIMLISAIWGNLRIREGNRQAGNGFFETVSTLRNKTILKSEQDQVWTDELKAVIAYYA